MTYDKAYFFAKFAAIPDERWCVGHMTTVEGRHCATGHCLSKHGHLEREARTLITLLGGLATNINDGGNPYYQQPTPKARVLAALNDLP